jgi:hypothetical protein
VTMDSGELDFAKHVIGWWPWIMTGTYSLLITIFAVPAMIKASPNRFPVSPIIVVVGGAALLMTLLGTIEAAHSGAFTGQGIANFVSFVLAYFVLAYIVLSALVGLSGLFAGACIDAIRSKLLAR